MSTPHSRPAPRPSLLVVVPSHNGGELTLACLDRTLPQLRARDRLVVVDNGSWDGTTAAIGYRFGDAVPVIARQRALGFAGACNLGAADAAADLIVFLNQDLLLSPDALDRLRESARIHPNAILGALLFEPEQTTIQHAGGVVLPNALTQHPHRGIQAHELPARGFVTSDYVAGALFVVPTPVFDRLDGFDVRFAPAYFEETDFCIRARAIGIPSLVALSVTARHFEAVTTGKDSPRYHFSYHRNRLRFVMKHYTLDALRTRFLPSERAWLRSSLSSAARQGVGRAYAALVPELPRWVLERRRRPPLFVPQEVAP
ncbi:MAG: glycosyltransferase family 2 protein [Candidatus Eisenbacteria bacterium]|jgi:GT2 family glycosyltransferase|nr:glycosyltransferase family 2 protein [Candidatus Eisenbacteria bacterium]